MSNLRSATRSMARNFRLSCSRNSRSVSAERKDFITRLSYTAWRYLSNGRKSRPTWDGKDILTP